MARDEFIADMERTMPVPVTSFPWQDRRDSHQWAPEMAELLAFLEERGRKSSVLFTGSGERFAVPSAEYWKAAYNALLFVVSTSEPCPGHILRSRMCDVLEARLPGRDEFHAEVLGRFSEAMHTVFTKENF